ncbi:MAG: aldolase catalytic domain-containing protein [Saprospiraceae bacterium]
MPEKKSVKFLDCTLRDGGYYTDWDFNKSLTEDYFSAVNQLPIDYIQVGYRSKPLDGYYGEYFYLPEATTERLRQQVNQAKVAVMLDEKNVTPELAVELLRPCQGWCSMVRFACKPDRISSMAAYIDPLKEMGFEVAINMMYLSKVDIDSRLKADLKVLNNRADYFYLVDSYGGLYPQDLRTKMAQIREVLDVPVGYHGHNNLEMALINTITAIEEGAAIVDATLTGMGRGAGNLKTELFLTWLNSQQGIEVDNNALGTIVQKFYDLKEKYNWGTSYPYMVSGAWSLPQADVMNWITKNRYSVESIIQALNNKKDNVLDNQRFDIFEHKSLTNSNLKRSILIGGGQSVVQHQQQILDFLNRNQDVVAIFSSSRNLHLFADIQNPSVLCLVGDEGSKLEKRVENTQLEKIQTVILPPYPRTMGSNIPNHFHDKTFELNAISFTEKYTDSPLAIGLQTMLDLATEVNYLVGFDGYTEADGQKVLLNEENQFVINAFLQQQSLIALTPTKYSGVTEKSIYAPGEQTFLSV